MYYDFGFHLITTPLAHSFPLWRGRFPTEPKQVLDICHLCPVQTSQVIKFGSPKLWHLNLAIFGYFKSWKQFCSKN